MNWYELICWLMIIHEAPTRMARSDGSNSSERPMTWCESVREWSFCSYHKTYPYILVQPTAGQPWIMPELSLYCAGATSTLQESHLQGSTHLGYLTGRLVSVLNLNRTTYLRMVHISIEIGEEKGYLPLFWVVMQKVRFEQVLLGRI